MPEKKGGFVSSEEAIGVLWEDEPASPVVLARYRKVAMRLNNTLKEYGISEIMMNEMLLMRKRLSKPLFTTYLFGAAGEAGDAGAADG